MAYRPHSNKSLYRLEVLSLCGSFLTIYCGTFFYGAAMDDVTMQLMLSAVLIFFNALIIVYFIAMVLREVVRSQLGLEKISRADLLKFFEESAWGNFGHRNGPWPRLCKWILLWVIWKLAVSMRGRQVSKERIRKRLQASFEHNTLVANARERQRRSLRVAAWIVHGSISTMEICERVVKYEVRIPSRRRARDRAHHMT
jgi:hypothetical protein